MAKLNKQYYYTSKGEKKINCYHIIVTKDILKKAGIEEDDELSIYADYGTIVVAKKYHCTCMECDYEWESGKDWGIQTACPRCKVGDVRYDINGGYNDNQEQRIKEDD